tara:strand:- start:211 stop:435 length:225 start_codon:yes stop_codon:yes gene_type:complete
MNMPSAIKEQWTKPNDWAVEVLDDAIEVSDSDGDFVVSSLTHRRVNETIEEHLKKMQTEAAFKLLLSAQTESET